MPFRQDLRFAVRLVRRNPGTSIVALIVLALGIGGTTAVFSVVRAVLLRPLPYSQPSRLVDLSQLPLAGAAKQRPFRVSLDEVEAWRRGSRTLSSIGSFVIAEAPVFARGHAVNAVEAAVDPEFLPTLGVRPLLGSNFSGAGSSVKDRSVIVAHRLWLDLFGGSPSALGAILLIDSRPYTVRGVLPAGFSMPRADASYFARRPDVLIPVANIAAGWGRGSFQWFAFGRLRPGVTASAAQAELRSMTAHLVATQPALAHVRVLVRGLHAATVAAARPALLISLTISLVLLLIACINVMILQFARGAARGSEIGVRQALGASARQLTGQLLTEAALLAGAGALLGALLARLFLGGLIAFWPTFLPTSGRVSIDPVVLGYSILAACVATLLAGLAPALRFGRQSAPVMLASTRRGAGRGLMRFQHGLMAGQVALGFVLLTAAGLLAHSLATLDAVPAGYRTEGVLGLQVDFAQPAVKSLVQAEAQAVAQIEIISRIVAKVRALPGVKSAAWGSFLPPQPRLGFFAPCRMSGVPPSRSLRFCNTQTVGREYFATIGTPLILGRDFTPEDDSVPVAIVNQAMARHYFEGVDPLGVKIATSLDPPHQLRTIIGVVADSHDRGLASAPIPTVYVPYRQSQLVFGAVVLRTGLPGGVIFPEVRRVIGRVDPQAALSNYASVAQQIARSTDAPRFDSLMSSACALMAALFVGLGLFGVISFAVSERSNEIGIRMALGALPVQIRRAVSAQAIRLTLAGLAAGALLALLTVRSLSSLLFHVRPFDPVAFGVAGIVVLLLALAASYGPALRASRLDPMVILRR